MGSDTTSETNEGSDLVFSRVGVLVTLDNHKKYENSDLVFSRVGVLETLNKRFKEVSILIIADLCV